MIYLCNCRQKRGRPQLARANSFFSLQDGMEESRSSMLNSTNHILLTQEKDHPTTTPTQCKLQYYRHHHHHHHHTVQITMHAFSICAIALQKRSPPPPPPHSASYNIMTTTTSARRVSALVGHRKRPPVQVTAEPGQHQHQSNHHICHRVNVLDG